MKKIKVLVAIANHGTKNKAFLEQLIAEYSSMPIECKIIVLSDLPKSLGDNIEVVVGAPNKNPWSLPFAHRPLFVSYLHDYDYFIYSEDDTLLTWDALSGFIESEGILKDNEIAGFIRFEKNIQTGEYFYSTCHSYFRWIPGSVRIRGGDIWAVYSNEHAACYVLSQKQLMRLINIGAFPAIPYEGRHDMLCTAATDFYELGKFDRLINISQLDRFTIPHLPNKYLGKLGLPFEMMAVQIDTLKQISLNQAQSSELINPESKMPSGFGSKYYHEPKDCFIAELISDNKQVLFWGAGDGYLEKSYKNENRNILVLPLDSIMAASCKSHGLEVISPLDLSLIDTDMVVLIDVLQLHENPNLLVSRLLKNTKSILIRVPNLNFVRLIKKRFLGQKFKFSQRREVTGVHKINLSFFSPLHSEFKSLKVVRHVPTHHKINRLIQYCIPKAFLSILFKYSYYLIEKGE